MDIITFISKHEGIRKNAYQDSLGIWTIGVGFNLERQGADAALAAAGINRDMIWAAIEEAKKAGFKKTTDLLSLAQIYALLATDVEDSTKDCRVICPGIDTWPENARAVLIDLHFNMGGTSLRGFKNTLAAFRAKNWKQAAANLEVSKWYTQVGARAKENVALLRAI